MTASGKQSESEIDGTGHKSWPTESRPYDPSLFLDPKIGKHGRIENGSGPPKTLPTHHVAECAVMSGERQPRKRSWQGASNANEQLPPPQLPKEQRRQKRAHAHRTSDQRHFHPSRWTQVEREERKPHGTQHQVHPETPPPPISTCPPEGREEEEDASGCLTSEEVRARGEDFGTGGREPEGREHFLSAYDLFFAKASHCAEDHSTQMSQVKSMVHIFPLHLVQVGWGSLSKEDRNAPHFWPPTPGQSLNPFDITNNEKEERWKILKFQKVEETPIHPPNVNKDADEGQDHTEREVFTHRWLSKE